MSGGKERKQTNQMLEEQRQTANTREKQFEEQQAGRSDTSYNRGNQTYEDIYGGFKNFASGNFAQLGGGGSGGFAPSGKWGDVETAYRTAMGKEGGLDPSRVGSMDEALTGFGNIGKYGASDETSAARLRGAGVYDELAKTGGVSPEEAANIRARAARTGTAVYGGLQQDIGRMSRAAGGGGPAYAAASSRLARQGAQQAGQSALDADTAVSNMVREGRLAGAQGLTSTEQAITQNQLSGLGSQFGGQKGLAESIRSGQQYGTEGLAGLASQEDARAASAAANASASADEQARYKNQMMLTGLGGLFDLRGQEYGAQSDYDASRLQNRGVWDASSGRIIDQRMQNNPQRSWVDYVAPFAGAATGALTGGFGGMGGGSNTNQVKLPGYNPMPSNWR